MIQKVFCVVKMFLGNPIETFYHLVITVYPSEISMMTGCYGLLLIRHNAILRYASKSMIALALAAILRVLVKPSHWGIVGRNSTSMG